MKQNNRYLWLFAMVFLTVFIGCQKDDTLVTHQQHDGEHIENRLTRTQIDFKTLKSKISDPKVLADIERKMHKNTPKSGGTNDFILYIDTSRIIEYSNDSITTYTMTVITSDQDTEKFTNIVLKEDKGVVTTYLLRYTPTEQWKEDTLNGNKGPFSGIISILNNDGTVLFEAEVEDYMEINSTSFSACSATIEPMIYCTNPNNPNPYVCVCGVSFVVGYVVVYGEDCSGNGGGPNDGPLEGDIPGSGGGESDGGSTESGNNQQIPGTEPIYNQDCNTSPQALGQLFPNSPLEVRQTLSYYINEYGEAFGINTEEKLQHFLAQVGAETGGLTTLSASENMNYTTPSRLIAVWPSKFSFTDPAKANPNNYINNPQGLANLVYCCRYGNGNVATGDGWNFRGGGIMQLTWKANYTDYYNFLQSINLGWTYSGPEDVRNLEMHAIISGMWYFKDRVLDRMEIHSNTTADMVTQFINPGANKQMKQLRRNYFNQATQNINCQ